MDHKVRDTIYRVGVGLGSSYLYYLNLLWCVEDLTVRMLAQFKIGKGFRFAGIPVAIITAKKRAVRPKILSYTRSYTISLSC